MSSWRCAGEMARKPEPAKSSIGAMEPVRIDKWLWAARFFKSRAQAARACELGRVQLNGLRAKPAREVHVGARLRIENEGGIFEIEALEPSTIRGPAAMAQKLYHETDLSREARMTAAKERKAMRELAPAPERKPSKRDRRRIIRFCGN